MKELTNTSSALPSQERADASQVVNPWMRYLSLAWSDFSGAIASWRIWWILGLNDVRQRYQRSRLGQFWITASMAVFIAALTIVYSTLFRMDVRDYAPFIVGNIVLWTFIATAITDSCTVFTQSEGFLKQERLPKLIFPLRLLVRNSIVFAHNAVLIPIVFLAAGHKFNWATIAIVPGFLMLLLINGIFVILLVGLICTRFRDFPQIISNLVQVCFFITPVVWHPSQVSGRAAWLVDWNPLAQHMMLIIDPLNGVWPSLRAYIFCVVLLFALALITGALFARFRARIVYWL